jgi:hypothetical protein
MNRTLAILAIAMLGGCASMNQPFSGMTAAEITAAVKEKDASATCINSPTPWGQGKVLWVNVDANVVRNGGFTVGADCSVTFNNTANTPATPGTVPGTTTTIVVPK